jgi:hypothetical protein
MGTHWVKALTVVRSHDEAGILTTYQPGDWLPVKNQQLRILLAKGQVEIQPQAYKTVLDLVDCGVVIIDGNLENAQKYIAKASRHIEVVGDDVRLAFPRTLLWDGQCKMRLDLMPVGFHRLTTGWQVAAPIYSYQVLAQDIGDEEDRARTLEIVRDLRVPVYDSRMVFVRRCGDTERLMEAWEAEGGGDERLALLRALYIVKPTICALPPSWIKRTNGR